MENFPEGKFLTTVKIGPKGQIVIPKEVRDMFSLNTGDSLLLMADKGQGIALQPFSYMETLWNAVNNVKNGDKDKKMNALEVRELTKVYPEFTLDKVSFFVKQGHISGLIGRNGAGKSTTIKGILRLINAEGSVSVFGKDFLNEEMTVKQMIGYVGGGFRYYPMNTLAAIRKAYAPFYPSWNQSRYEKFLSQFELIESKKVKELSEGMKVKFALALALSHGAKLLIMDEPTSGLDPLSREEFCDIILQLVREEGVSVLFSTHITSDLMRIADDIVYISQGKILAACPLKELLCKYNLAHFSSLADASAVNAIGVKAVKEGYEGLLPRDMQISESIAVTDATIDNIIVHLEKENEEKKHVKSN